MPLDLLVVQFEAGGLQWFRRHCEPAACRCSRRKTRQACLRCDLMLHGVGSALEDLGAVSVLLEPSDEDGA